MLKISTIINYCSNDYRFIKPVIDNALKVSQQVVVPVCSSFFDGSPENRYILNKTYKESPEAEFIEFPFVSKYRQKYGPHFPPNVSRWVGFKYIKKDVDAILFLDSDELVDYERFNNWLNTPNLKKYDCFRFITYWYFRDITIRRKMFGRTIVMIKTPTITDSRIFTRKERLGLLQENNLGRIMHSDGEPMFHHFSWVRTKKEMLKKVKTWSHCNDRQWDKFVEAEFSREFNGREFVRGQQCEFVDPPIKLTIPMTEENPTINKKVKRFKGKNVRYLNELNFTKELTNALK
jgi:hypothetical protein